MPGSSCDCSSPGLQVGWLGREPAACLFLEFLSLFWGTCALVSLIKTDLSQCSGSSCGRAQGSSFFPCLLFADLHSEVSFSPGRPTTARNDSHGIHQLCGFFLAPPRKGGVPFLRAVAESQHSLPTCHKRRPHCVGLCGHVACVLYA